MPADVPIRSCSVHGVALRRQPVRIQYGLVMQLNGYREARQALFPNADEPHMGGCVVDDSFATETTDDVCTACNEARDAWHEAYPRGDPPESDAWRP